MGIIRIDSADDDRLSEFRNVPDPNCSRGSGSSWRKDGSWSRGCSRASSTHGRCSSRTRRWHRSRRLLTDRTVPSTSCPGRDERCDRFNFHRGCLAIGVRPPARDWREVMTRRTPTRRSSSASGTWTTSGSIFRNAAAFGVDGGLLQADCADPLYREGDSHVDGGLTDDAVCDGAVAGRAARTGRGGWATVAMTPAADAPLLRDVAATLSRQAVAIVLGHEGEGLTKDAIRRARIGLESRWPHGVDSVNVATAAAIALYEMGSGVI